MIFYDYVDNHRYPQLVPPSLTPGPRIGIGIGIDDDDDDLDGDGD